ncbi:DUF4157 domain-containing protein [Mucilaginibacter sp. RCC_168]|uniref:eCIS core domain-containing protein n=1 Tax=Mucilaginibacter sp. RCC_168 TaxID=3239221 RepID=UPI003526B119
MNSHKHINPVSKPEKSMASKSLFFQPKLTVNQPNDIYEQEADTMAELVMSKNDQSDNTLFFKPAPRQVIQPKCSACEAKEEPHMEEEEAKEETSPEPMQPIADLPIQRKCAHCDEEEENKKIDRKEISDNSPVVTANVEQTIQSSGQQLDGQTRGFMENRFGHDFGDVQIHNDSQAHQSSKDINALAYTHQNHIAFAAGQYQPDTDTGKRLLAHELTHVLQQDKNISRKIIQRDPGPSDGKSKITLLETKGNISEDVKILKGLEPGLSRTLIIQGNILMLYKIDGATPIQLKSFHISNDTVLPPFYNKRINGLFYAGAHDNVANKDGFIGKKDNLSAEEQKKLEDLDNAYTISNWFNSDTDYDNFKKSVSDGEVIGLIVMPYGGASPSKGAKGGDDQEEIPPKPKWANAFEKSMADIIESTRNAEPTSEDIPASFNFYYSKSKSKWRGYAAQKDAADKAVNKVYTDVNESDKPADLLTNIRELIRIEKLKSVLDVKPSKDATALSASMQWSYELKLKIEKLMADERKMYNNLYDLPDKISLATNEGDEANIYLRIDVFVTSLNEKGADEAHMKSGVLPDPLRKEMKAEDVLKVIKVATKVLRGGDIKMEGRETKSFDHVKKAYPSNIIAKDVRPDAKTVTGAHHSFKMNVQLEKLEGTDTLNLMTLNMRTVYYYWDIYRVDDQLSAEEKADLSSSWKERRESLVAHFRESGQLKTKPLVNTEKLELYNRQMDEMGLPDEKVNVDADLSRQKIEELKSADIFYGSRLNITPDADFTFPKDEGEYIIYCRAQVEPTDDKVIIRPSEAFFPIKVENGNALAKESVNKPFNEIEDVKKQLAEATADEDKKRLETKLKSLTDRQAMSLADRLTADVASKENSIRLAKKLKEISINNKGTGKPISLAIAADKADAAGMADIWVLLSMNDPAKSLEDKIEELIANLTSQEKGLADVQKNLQSFSGDYDHSKPTYTPVVSLISQETGQEYQLITMIGEAKDSTDAETKIVLIDVTTHKTQRKYSGSSTNADKTVALQEAIQDAFTEFGKECEYGKGSVQYRIPVINAEGSVTSKPGIKKTILGILEAVAAVAGIAALVVGTVATGGALAIALGVGSAVVGASVAGYHIYDRYENHKLEPDVELAMDILNILGPLLVAVNTAVKGAKLASFALKTAEGFSAANTFLKIEKGIALVQKAELATNFFAINYKTVKDLNEIENSNLSPEQKDALEKQVMVNAVFANVMIAVAVRNEVKAKASPSEQALNEAIGNAANEQKYKLLMERAGLIDAEGKWTVPELNEAAAKSPAVDPNDPAQKESTGTAAPPVTTDKSASSGSGSSENKMLEAEIFKNITPETKEMLTRKPALAKALLENPLAAKALKLCNSPCFPEFATGAQIAEIEAILNSAGLRTKGEVDLGALKEFLHEAKTPGDLNEKIDILRDAGNTLSRDLDMGKSPFEIDRLNTTEKMRSTPGEVSGGEKLPVVTEENVGKWYGEPDPKNPNQVSEGNIMQLPKQVVDKLKAQFKGKLVSFRTLREAFWTEMFNDPVINKFFKDRGATRSLTEMQNGRAPFALKDGRTGGGANAKLQLNHTQALEHLGENSDEVVNFDNLEIVSPKFHEDMKQ